MWAILGALLVAPFALLVFNTFNAPPAIEQAAVKMQADTPAIQLTSSVAIKHAGSMDASMLSVTTSKAEVDPVSVSAAANSICTTTSYGIEDDPRLRLFEEL